MMMSDLPMVEWIRRVGQRCALKENGDQSVTIHGIKQMLIYSVTGLDLMGLVSQIPNYSTSTSHAIIIITDPINYYNSYYGDGYGPTMWNYLNCQGWEKNVFECTKTVYPDQSCHHDRIAGVLCKEGTNMQYNCFVIQFYCASLFVIS